ncbi:Fc.00g106560.m01.CDS01 [Cosmosporella sp. VM-42]
MDIQHDLDVRRKPVPNSGEGGFLAPIPRRPLRPARSATNLTGAHHPPQQSGLVDEHGHLQVGFVVDEPPSPGYLDPRPTQEIRRVKSSSALSTTTPQEEKPKENSKWKAALGEAQYFAGGLISHPAESTRHFTIIRHSHALVWYRGPSTSLPVSILSDAALPPNRTMWLQQKGFSGNMGMSLKALMGTNGNWIDVTPATKAGVEHLPEKDERGIQRDLKRFFKKASGRLKKHLPRETHIIRIPATAIDGYFRLVLCAGEAGKKVLCGSPVFRIASTSTDISVVRGASLSTMPLEVGIKVATTVGQQVARKYTGIAGAIVENRAKKFVPNAAVKKAARIAYQDSGLGGAVGESWKNGKTGRYDPMVAGAMLDGPLAVVGPDTGPKPPFPIKFDGKVVMGTGISTRDLNIPTANLREVPDPIKMRMGGVFAAWACILPLPGLEDIAGEWYEAVVTIAPLRNGPPGVVLKNKVAVSIINDFEDATFFDARLKVLLMGYLHPATPNMPNDNIAEEHAQDVMTTLASLGRENWAPHETVTRMKTLKSERSFQDLLGEATGKVQSRVDRIPVHWAGVRSESGTMRDQVYGTGGLWIPR